VGVLFAIIYGTSYPWWESVTGVAAEVLGAGVSFALFKSMLAYWGVQTVALNPATKQSTPDTLGLALTWFTLAGLFMVMLALIFLIMEAVLNIRSDPDPQPAWPAHRVIRIGKHDTKR
jgi:hypothetical protein